MNLKEETLFTKIRTNHN